MAPAFLLSTSCWALVLAVIFAPWAYGSTRPECIEILDTILVAAFGLWALSCLAARRIPSIPLPLVIFTVLIFLQGWWMVINSQGFVDLTYCQFVPGNPMVSFLPGSVDGAVSLVAMTSLSALLSTLLMAVDLTISKVFRLRLFATMIITGTALSLFAFWILRTDSQILYWPYGTSPFMFGTFRYHGNAGAYLNLVWPLAAAITLYSFLRPTSSGQRIFNLGCTGILLLAVVINASKGGQVVAAGLFCSAFFLLFLFRKRLFGELSLGKSALLALVFLGLIAACLTCIDLDRTEARWDRFSQSPVDHNRLEVATICVEMIPTAGFFGFGADTFHLMFPGFNISEGSPVPWFWQEAHEDYLQTVVEWGYIGTLLWTLVVAGGFFRLGYSMWKLSEGGSSASLVIPATIFLTILGVFCHSFIDFPLQVASLRLYLLIFLAMAWSSPAWMEERTRVRKKRRIILPSSEKSTPAVRS